MSRGLWFAAGAGAGVWAMVRGRRAAEVLTADGLRDRLGAVGLGARLLRDEVATARVEKQTELRATLGLDAPTRPELTGGRHRADRPEIDPRTAPGATGSDDEEGST